MAPTATDTAASEVATNAQLSIWPAHGPVHERTVPSGSETSSTTAVPFRKLAVQTPEKSVQSIPAGVDTTRVAPFGLAPIATVSLAGDAGAKVAVTARSQSIFTVQSSSVPVHAPDQPVNTDPGLGYAVTVTTSPLRNCWLQSSAGAHATPPSELCTTPPADPGLVA